MADLIQTSRTLADLLLQQNDEAYERVETVVQQIAQSLGFKHVKWCPESPVDFAPPPPASGCLYPMIPHAFGLFAVEEDVQLYCSTRMRAELLEEHFKERLGIDKDIALATSETKLVVPHEVLLKLKLSLPNSLDLVLHHPRISIDEVLHKEREHETQLGVRYNSPLRNVEHLPGLYRRAYLVLREWAYRVGIMSEECRLLSEEYLTMLFTSAFCTCTHRLSATVPDGIVLQRCAMARGVTRHPF